MAAAKELRDMIKEKADGGDDLAKGVQDTFGEKPDSLLIRFIRARKYDVPRAFDLMKGSSGERTVSPHYIYESNIRESNNKPTILFV